MNFRVVSLMMLSLAWFSHAGAAEERHVVVISIDGLPGRYLDDPLASLPVIRSLAKSGVRANQGMLVSNPSVTWPNHTTLMTGVHPETHGVIFNGGLERDSATRTVKVNPKKTQKDLVKVPLLFDILKSEGISSAAINWPCTRESTTIADNFPDVPDNIQHSTPRLVAELNEANVLRHFDSGSAVVRDEIWTDAACHILKTRKPRLLALHLLNLDGTHHRYGPETPPGYTAAALTDALVGRVLHALDDAGIRDRTAVFIVSDHGFIAIHKAVHANLVLKNGGLIEADGAKIRSARAMVIPEGGTGLVYLTNPETAKEDAETVRKLFGSVEGIADILGPEDFGRLSMPDPSKDSNMANLLLVAKEGYTISGSLNGSKIVVPNRAGITGSHGYVSTEPKMNAIFVAAGSGIQSGVKLDLARNIDVAPTVSSLLGVKLENAKGKVLTSILSTESK